VERAQTAAATVAVTPWSDQRIVDAAPDASSVAAGRKLAAPGPWSETGVNDSLLWGRCQGSGSTPYQVSVDLLAPAYRCSCPSRKFPCKHAIALLLLWSAGGVGEGGGTAEFAQTWAEQRDKRARSRAASPEDRAPADPEAQARRQAERAAKMDAGIEEFTLWLGDLARAGLADARGRERAWWDGVAARLVDAQLPALAEQVRDAGGAIRAGLGDRDLLQLIGRWWMLAQGWSRRETLPADEQAELRTALGWPVPTAEVLAGESRTVVWSVAGVHRDLGGRLQQQRTWLRDDDGEHVLLLEISGPGSALGTPQLVGSRLRATVGLYPGSSPRRALFDGSPEPAGVARDLGAGMDVASAHAAAAEQLATAPWRVRFPVLLGGVTVAAGEETAVVDAHGHALPLVPEADRTTMLAITGGAPCDVFGEVEDGRLRILSLVTDDGVVAL